MAGNTVKFRALIEDKVSSTLDKIRDKFDQLGGKGSAASLFGNVGAKAVAKGFDLVGDAASKAVEFLGDSVDAASNLRESMSLSAQVFEKQADNMSAWGDTTAKVFGQSKREALQFAAGFGTAFKNVGFALDETADKSQEMTRLAADLGSAFNSSSEEAATALRAGLLGESEPMRRFGVFLSETRVKAKALEMGMKPLNGAFSDGQKVTARYAIIMEDTADSQGMFGRDTESLADAQKSLTAAMEDLQAEVGTALLPVLKDMAVWLRDEGIPALKDLGGVMSFLIGPADEYKEALENLKPTMGSTMEGFTTAAKEAETGVGGSFKRIAFESGKASDKVVASIDEITDSFKAARAKWTDAGQGAADAFWEPQIAEMEEAANRREIRETEVAIKSGKLKGKELADAKLHLAELNKTEMEMLATLASFGNKKAAATLKNMIDVARASGNLSKEQIAWFDKLEAQIDDTAQAARDLVNALISSKVVKPGSANQKRASGGPVWPGVWTVGEEGPETLVLGRGGGYVIPNQGGGSGSGGGSSMAPAIIQLVLDERVISEVANAGLYRELRRASATTGRT